MLKTNPYYRLMRLHQPVGFWLCYWPSVWAILLAAPGQIHWELLLLFLLGAVVTRAAGCTVNDIADRHFDREVERTRSRPLASGELKVTQALVCLAVLLKIAFLILVAVYFLLPSDTSFLTLLGISLPVLLLSTAYPFMKRITWWPQAFLGLTFNWGVFIGWVAVRGTVEWPAFALYIAAFFWTLGYDTVYGYQDQKDDEKIGVKSTSRLLAAHSRKWILAFYSGTFICFGAALLSLPQAQWLFYLPCLFIMGGHFLWQVRGLDISNPAVCLKIFKSNALIGGIWILPAVFSYTCQFLGNL